MNPPPPPVAGSASGQQARQPNILLIVADDVGQYTHQKDTQKHFNQQRTLQNICDFCLYWHSSKCFI